MNTEIKWFEVQKKRDGGSWYSVADVYNDYERALDRIEQLTGDRSEEAHDDDVTSYRIVESN